MNDPTPPADSPAGRAEGHLIQQAEVPPLDVDGVQAAVVGTALFAVASMIMAIGYDRLVAAGDGWWLGVALSGLGLGVVGLAAALIRRRRRRRSAATVSAA